MSGYARDLSTTCWPTRTSPISFSVMTICAVTVLTAYTFAIRAPLPTNWPCMSFNSRAGVATTPVAGLTTSSSPICVSSRCCWASNRSIAALAASISSGRVPRTNTRSWLRASARSFSAVAAGPHVRVLLGQHRERTGDAQLHVDEEQERQAGGRDRPPGDLPPSRAAPLLLGLGRLGRIGGAFRLGGQDVAVVVRVRAGGPLTEQPAEPASGPEPRVAHEEQQGHRLVAVDEVTGYFH